MSETARDILHYFSPGDVDLDGYDAHGTRRRDVWRDALARAISGMMTPQRTGGADWSARYVWRLPADLRLVVDHRLMRAGEVFLVWSEGDLYEPLYFVLRTQDEDGDWQIEDSGVELTAHMLHRFMELAQREPGAGSGPASRQPPRRR